VGGAGVRNKERACLRKFRLWGGNRDKGLGGPVFSKRKVQEMPKREERGSLGHLTRFDPRGKRDAETLRERRTSNLV